MENELALRPFVPAKDFALSKRFYQAIGFQVTLEDHPIAVMKAGSFSFILQNFYLQQHAENCMVQLMVRNLTTWWDRIDGAKLVTEFGIKLPKPPAMQSWGMKVGFVSDPSGVLWHVAESIF